MSEKEETPHPGHHETRSGQGDEAGAQAHEESEVIWHDDDDDDDDDPPMAPHRKEGRGCFLTLLIVSAIPVVFFLITFTGGGFPHLHLHEKLGYGSCAGFPDADSLQA